MTLLARRTMRVGACAFVLALCGVWVLAGIGPWRSERLTEAVEVGDPPLQQLVGPPWTDAPARVAARKLLLEGLREGEADAERLLAHSIRARPLYAPSWLARAQLAAWQGRLERADAYASLSTLLWPTRDRLHWRVAMLRITMGDRDGALRALRAHQRGRTSGMDRVVWFAAQIEPDPGRLVEQLMPEREWSRSEADSYLTQLLGVAAQTGRTTLERRAWDALSEKARARPYAVRTHVEAMISAGRAEEAISAWDHYWTPRGAGSPITNPGFEEPLALGGLGWRIHPVRGVGWTRDRQVRFDGKSSLRIWFDGDENLDYRHAFQWIRVEPEHTYLLKGHWRGVDITTSSGPYLEIVADPGGESLRVRGPARTGSWEWSDFELKFRAPSRTRLVELRVRRDRARGWVRGVSGSLWIDDLALLPVEGGALDG